MNEVNIKNDTIVSDFGLRFRLLMSYHNLTLKDVATYTRNAIPTVGTWKNGRITTSGEPVSRLAEIFQVSEEFLLKGRSGYHSARNADEKDVLQDIDTLMYELEQGLQKGDTMVNEPPKKPLVSKNHPSKDRLQLEAYFRSFLEEAERHPDGLSHVWYQLRREFPPDLFQQLRRVGP